MTVQVGLEMAIRKLFIACGHCDAARVIRQLMLPVLLGTTDSGGQKGALETVLPLLERTHVTPEPRTNEVEKSKAGACYRYRSDLSLY